MTQLEAEELRQDLLYSDWLDETSSPLDTKILEDSGILEALSELGQLLRHYDIQLTPKQFLDQQNPKGYS